MRTPKRLVWSEGLLMSPQHLQQLDRYHEDLLSTRMDALDPYSWGLIHCAVDPKALSTGHVRFNELSVVLPDGTAVAMDAGHPDLPASRTAAEHFPHTQQALEVYIGLPREREGVDNYARQPNGSVRYRAVSHPVRDLGGSGQQAEVTFAQPNLRILFGNEPREDYVTLKVLELVRDDAGQLMVADPYVPPCVRISASPFLMSGLRRLLNLMVARQQAVASERRQKADGSVEFSSRDITRFLLLSSVNTFIPVLTHMVDTGNVTPRTAYLFLTQLAGQLTTLSSKADPSQMPKFQFLDLRATFEELFARITSLLQETVQEHYISVPLSGREDGLHTAELRSDNFLQCERFFIGVQSNLADQQVASQLPMLCKVASWNDVNNILAAATPGAALQPTFQLPPEIPAKAGVVYFAVSTDTAYWRNIVTSRTIAVYLPLPFEPQSTRVELFGLMGRESAGPGAFAARAR